MQKFFIVPFLLFGYFLSLAICGRSQNLIKDGAFEKWNSNIPGSGGWDYLVVRNKNWQFSKDENGNLITPAIHSQLLGKSGILKLEEKDVHSGNKALRGKGSFYLAPTKARSAQYKTDDGTEYLVKFWVKGDGIAKVYMHVYGEGKPLAEIISYEGKPQKDKWTQIKETIKVFGKGAKSVFPRISLSKEMLVDDIFIGRIAKNTQMSLAEEDPECDARIAFAYERTDAIKIDGIPNEKAWKKAPAFGGFRSYYSQAFLVPLKSNFRILRDDENLYFLFESALPDAASVLNELKSKPLKNKDGSLKDKSRDVYTARYSIELFLQAPGNAAYCQFVASLDGYRYDGTDKNKADWRGSWKFATSVKGDKWFTEMRIPAKDFNLKSIEKMKEWRLNAAVNYEGNYSTWAAVGGDFHKPYSFGRMITSSYNDWAKLTKEGLETRIARIQRNAIKQGLSFSSLEGVKEFKKSINNESCKGKADWKKITKAYLQIAFMERACKSMESIIKFRKYFNGKGLE